MFNLFSYFVSASCVLLPASCFLCPAHDARNSRQKLASRQKAPSNNHFLHTTQRNPAKNLRRDRRRRPITASSARRKEFPLKTCVATEGAVQATVSCARRKKFPPKTCVATEGGVASKGGRRHGIRQHGIIFTVQRYGEYSMQIRIFFPTIRIFIQNTMHIS